MKGALYEEEVLMDNIDSGQDYSELQQLVEGVNALNEKLDALTTEEVTEVTEYVTEEITEEIPEEDLPLQKKDAQALSDDLKGISDQLTLLNNNLSSEESSEVEETTEEPQLAMTTETTEDENGDLVLVDHGVDGHLYMSTQVENADLNDIYSMLLSTRNVLLLGVMLGLVVACFFFFRMAIERLFYR